MGTAIGQTAARMIPPTSVVTPRRLTTDPGRAARPEEANPFNRPDRVEVVRAGFGADTLSPGGAALQTLGVNLRRAKEMVQTELQIREESRARREEADAAVGLDEKPNQAEAAPREEVMPARPEAPAQLRGYAASRLAEAAPAPQPRFRPEAVAAVPAERLDIRI